MSVSAEQKQYDHDSLFNNGEVKIPLVYIKKNDEYGERFVGFIPGFVMKNITAHSIEECKKELVSYLKQRLHAMITNKVDIPFFPDEEEIRQDYDDVYLVEFIKIRT